MSGRTPLRNFRSAACAIHPSGTNHLLELLPARDHGRLLGKMERLHVTRGSPVYGCYEPASHVHFPVSAVLSIVTVLKHGATAEMRTVGNEGFAGLALLFGTVNEAQIAYYQVAGETLRMQTADFVNEVSRPGAFRQVAHRYAQALILQLGWLTLCERLHPVERRVARCMVTCHDAAWHQSISLTQDVLAQTLGVRRSSVSIAAATLQDAGLISYRRGVIDVLDRARLEKASCECYAAIRGEFKRLLC